VETVEKCQWNQCIGGKATKYDIGHFTIRPFALSVRHASIKEAAMTAKTSFRITRWFRKWVRSNRSPYRWYEVDHCGM
jgi:hypothetical protein